MRRAKSERVILERNFKKQSLIMKRERQGMRHDVYWVKCTRWARERCRSGCEITIYADAMNMHLERESIYVFTRLMGDVQLAERGETRSLPRCERHATQRNTESVWLNLVRWELLSERQTSRSRSSSWLIGIAISIKLGYDQCWRMVEGAVRN